MTIRKVLIISMLFVLAACSAPYPDLTSPCVGGNGSPCERRPVNGDLNPMNQS